MRAGATGPALAEATSVQHDPAHAECRLPRGQGQREEPFGTAGPRRRAVGRRRSSPARAALMPVILSSVRVLCR